MKKPELIRARRAIGAMACVLLSLGALPLTNPAAAVQVDAELLLLVDVTKSIDATEFDVMMEGFAQSFTASEVIDSIQSGSAGRIAAAVIFFSDKNNLAVGVGWMEISDASSALAFATQLRAAVRASNQNGMALATALDFGSAFFGDETGGPANGFESGSQVITLVGDGIDTASSGNAAAKEAAVMAASQGALAAGVDMINAITIGGGAAMEDYYTQFVVGGSTGGLDGAVVDIASVATFQVVSEVVLDRTIGAAVPEPRLAGLMSLALLWSLGRRRRGDGEFGEI